MRHDFKYSQSHSSAIRQRPDGSIVLPSGGGGQQQYNMGYHRKHYHHDNEEHNNNNNYNRYNKDRYYSHSNSDVNYQNGATDSGGVVSALSVSHESEKQWEWLEEVLAKSTRNKETVSKYIYIPIFKFTLPTVIISTTYKQIYIKFHDTFTLYAEKILKLIFFAFSFPS